MSRHLLQPRKALLHCGGSLLALCAFATIGATRAQAAFPTSVVSACSGVSLPRSVVTDIVRTPLTNIVSPLQGTVNNILGVVGIIPLVGEVFPTLNIDVNGLLDNAASGAPISLSVLDNNGTIIGPSDQCNAISDSFQLNTQGGISIGGNRITGLGSNGLDAAAGEAGSIAFGNNALTSVAAVESVAIGTGASATAANGVALGAGSVADRAANAAYAAIGITGTASSAGAVSVGAAGAERQITNVAAGQVGTDAVNVAQLSGALDGLAAAASIQYSTPALPTTPNVGVVSNDVTLVGSAPGTPVALHNVAAGALAAGSTDAVNGGQLFTTNNEIAANTTAIATTSNALTILNNGVVNGTIGLVLQAGGAPGAGGISVGAATGGTVLTIAGTDGDRTLSGVAAGAVAAGSVDAVNGGQLFATNTQVGLNTSAIATNAADIVTNTANIAGNTTNIASLTNGTAGLFQQVGGAPGNGLLTVGAATGGTAVNFAGTAGARVLSGVAAGVASTDAVNLGQLNAVTANAANAVIYDVDGGGARIDSVTLVGGTAGPVTLNNVAAGALNATSAQAVNGAQLFATNTQVATNTADISSNTIDIALSAANISTANTNIANLTNGTAGLVQQVGGAPGAGAITVGAGTGGTSVSVAGTDGARTLTGLADGVLAAGSADAVNGAQLFATNSLVAANTTAIANNTTAIAGNTTSITNLTNGTAGLVQQVGGAPGNGTLTVGAATGGTSVDFAGTAGARILGGVAAGVAVTDAVNVGQLNAVTANAANAVRYDVDGGGNRLDSVTLAGGTSAPVTLGNVAAGAVTATSAEAVNGAQLFATNTQVTTNTTDIASNTTAISNATTQVTNLATGIDNGTRGLVQQAGGSPGSGAISVGAATGGANVSIAGTDGTRVLSGLSNGVLGSDAATIAQLASVTGGAFNAVQYDTDDEGTRTNTVTLAGGSAGPVQVTNVADGTVAAGSSDAVTGSQLAATNAQLAAQTIIVTQNTSNIDNILTGQAGAFRSDNSAGAAAPVASGADATAGGFGAVASGVQTVALGNGATASGLNSVAIGAGSSDGGQANVVSIGSTEQTRRLTNVGPAVSGTDAVNLNQLQTAQAQFQAAAGNLQGQIDSLAFDIRDVRRRANAGTAAALAAAGLPQAFTEGAGMIAAGIATFEGEVAFAFGASKIVGDQTIVKAGATFSTRGSKGFNAGVGYQF